MSSIRAILYNAAGHDEEIPMERATFQPLRDEQLLWVDGTWDEVRSLPNLPKEIAEEVDAVSDPYGLEIFETFYWFCVPSLPTAKSYVDRAP